MIRTPDRTKTMVSVVLLRMNPTIFLNTGFAPSFRALPGMKLVKTEHVGYRRYLVC
jgi:hypothetical protein